MYYAEVWTTYGSAIGGGLLIGGLVAIFNAWASR